MLTAQQARTSQNRDVLVVDDEASMRMALELSYGQRGWRVDAAAGQSEALACFRRSRHPLVVSDLRMADGDGLQVLKAVRALSPHTPVVLLTAFGAVQDAVSAMKAGACEFLTKPVAFERLLDLSEQIISQRRPLSGNCSTAIIGSSSVLRSALESARQAAESDADILIEAESGTGKELLARMIHSHSARREHPFVAVNCAALPETLLESELFGHGRGAFTGAFAAQSGKFEAASGGTLLLDEVGEIPLCLQPKLLRVLQEREFYRLGETKPVRIDVRIIASTNRSLSEMVAAGKFRADLYYRLNVIPLSLPCLRERKEDIRELAQYFAEQFGGTEGPNSLSDSFLAQLEQHSWPGNVRELANFIRRTLAMRSCTTPASLVAPSSERATRSLQGQMRNIAADTLRAGTSLETAERRLLETTLEATAGNRSRAAEMLGISVRTIRNKIREYQLPPKEKYLHVDH